MCISKFSQNEDILHLCSHQIAQIAFESPFCALYFAPSKTKPSFLSHAGLFIKVPKTGNAQKDYALFANALPFIGAVVQYLDVIHQLVVLLFTYR